MASRRHLLSSISPSLLRISQPQAQTYPQPRSKSYSSPGPSSTLPPKQKLDFHANQILTAQQKSGLWSARDGLTTNFIVYGIGAFLVCGLVVGIDKSKAEGKKRRGEEADGREFCEDEEDENEYWFFGMFVRRRKRGEELKPIEKDEKR